MIIQRRQFLTLAGGATAAMAVPTVPALFLSSPARAWQTNATSLIEKIWASRQTDPAFDCPVCGFLYGTAYFHLAASPIDPSGDRQPSLWADVRIYTLPKQILTTSKMNVVERLGFKPAISKKPISTMEIPIRRDGDLARVASFIYRVLEEVYEVRNFAATRYLLWLPPFRSPVGFMARINEAQPVL